MMPTTRKVLAAACLLAASASTASARLELGHLEKVQQRVEAIQQAIEDRGARWSAGATRVARLPDAQRHRLLGVRLQPGARAQPRLPVQGGSSAAPASLDWRDHPRYLPRASAIAAAAGGRATRNFVTPVKDQEGCGSCWAFSTTAALESYLLRTGVPPAEADLSEQAVLSCSGAGSCQGGLPYKAAEFLQKTGISGERDMPYSGSDEACAPEDGWRERAQRIGEWRDVPKKTADIKAALRKYGPLPTVMAVYEDFFAYDRDGGIYTHVSPLDGPYKNPLDFIVRKLFKDLLLDLDKPKGYHAILIVGYDEAEKAFIVKNSWGEDWGEDGYFRIAYSQVGNGVGFGAQTIAFVAPDEGPEITFTEPKARESVSGEVTVAGEVSEPSDLELQFDDRPFSPVKRGRVQGEWKHELGKLDHGVHRVTVRARDMTGGASEAAVEFRVVSPPEPDAAPDADER